MKKNTQQSKPFIKVVVLYMVKLLLFLKNALAFILKSLR